MLKLTRANESKDFHGFKLQNGFWFGIDTESNQYIATSGWECNGCVAIYFNTGDSWKMEWISIEDAEFELENLPEINMEGKMSFNEWLESELGVTPEYFDENYSGNQEFEEYNDYLYDGLPRFAREYL